MDKIVRLFLIRSLILYSFILYAEERAPSEMNEVYRTYEQILAELQQIESNHSGICKLYDIGDSWGKIYAEAGNAAYANYNHEIWAIKVSDNVTLEEDEPSLFFMGGMHASELTGVEAVLTVLRHITAQYGKDSELTNRINNSQVWFIPLVNPNGHSMIVEGIDSTWQKNIRDNNGNGVFDPEEDGVNLNRNFGYKWGETGASSEWSEETYHGPDSWSEPEAKAIREFIASHQFIAGISYHSSGETVLYPYGYGHPAKAPDFRALKDFAQDIAKELPGVKSDHYSFRALWQDEPRAGTLEDFAYGEHGVFSLMIELGTRNILFADEIETLCSQSIDAAMLFLNRTNYAMLTGHITDAVTGEPIVATIFIKDIDDTGEERAPFVSNKDFGTYYRLLKNGGYEITISAPGYIPQTFTEIKIFKDEVTILDVQLQPYATNTTAENDMQQGSNRLHIVKKLSGCVSISVPSLYNGSNLNIYNARGCLIDEFTISVSGNENWTVEWNTAHVAPGMYVLKIEGAKNNLANRFMVTK